MSDLIIRRTSLGTVAKPKAPEKICIYWDKSAQFMETNHILVCIKVMWEDTQKEGKIMYGVPYTTENAELKIRGINIEIPHSYTVIGMEVKPPIGLFGIAFDEWVPIDITKGINKVEKGERVDIMVTDGILIRRG